MINTHNISSKNIQFQNISTSRKNIVYTIDDKITRKFLSPSALYVTLYLLIIELLLFSKLLNCKVIGLAATKYLVFTKLL